MVTAIRTRLVSGETVLVSGDTRAFIIQKVEGELATIALPGIKDWQMHVNIRMLTRKVV